MNNAYDRVRKNGRLETTEKHDRQYYNVTSMRVRSTIVVVEKQKYYILLVCTVACPTLQHVSTLSHHWHDFEKRQP
jgi:hypothetical protein